MIQRVALILLALALGTPAVARGNADVPDGKWWKRPLLAQDLGLTSEQQNQIERVFVKSRTKLIDLKADLEKKQLLLQESMEDKAADRRDVERRIESVENARAELQKARALMVLDMKQILKPEQWERLLRRQEQVRERREMLRERILEGDGQRPNQRQARPNNPND